MKIKNKYLNTLFRVVILFCLLLSAVTVLRTVKLVGSSLKGFSLNKESFSFVGSEVESICVLYFGLTGITALCVLISWFNYWGTRALWVRVRSAAVSILLIELLQGLKLMWILRKLAITVKGLDPEEVKKLTLEKLDIGNISYSSVQSYVDIINESKNIMIVILAVFAACALYGVLTLTSIYNLTKSAVLDESVLNKEEAPIYPNVGGGYQAQQYNYSPVQQYGQPQQNIYNQGQQYGRQQNVYTQGQLYGQQQNDPQGQYGCYDPKNPYMNGKYNKKK